MQYRKKSKNLIKLKNGAYQTVIRKSYFSKPICKYMADGFKHYTYRTVGFLNDLDQSLHMYTKDAKEKKRDTLILS
jgi:hypothetical protein